MEPYVVMSSRDWKCDDDLIERMSVPCPKPVNGNLKQGLCKTLAARASDAV